MAVGSAEKYNFLVVLCLIIAIFTPGFAEIEELARKRKSYATQIGTFRDNTADRALDNDPNPDIGSDHCAQPHDASGQNAAWWMVDLGSEYAIYNVTIYSEDSTSNEHTLGYISVRVGDSADVSEHTVTDQCALWNKRKFPKDSNQTLQCDQVMYGRFVSIQRTGGDNPHNMILCEVKIYGRKIGLDDSDRLSVIPESITDVSATIRWEKIAGVPADDSNLYKYAIEYKDEPFTSWVEMPTRHSHDPSSDQYQEATLTGLMYNAVYDVRVKSYVRVNGQTLKTGVTNSREFRTLCRAPSVPTMLTIKREQRKNKINLVITWQAPQEQDYGDCRDIAGIVIQYRLASDQDDVWREQIDLRPGDTPHTLDDLEPEEYVVKLVVKNKGGITNFDEITSRYDTDCSKCNDNPCDSRKSCSQCHAGYQSVECRTACDQGYYGSCDDRCSEGCKDVCDHVSGDCNCKLWFKGRQCFTEIRRLAMPSDRPIVSQVTHSSAMIKWEKITRVPNGLSDHYEYAIEYRTDSDSWVEWQPRYSHDSSSGQYQEEQLDGLMYGTRYRVRLGSYRLQGDEKDRTRTTSEEDFDTECIAPEKPKNLTIKSADSGNKLSLTITWKAAPAYSDCRRITDYDIKYRLASAGEDDWIKDIDLSSRDTSYTLPDLDADNYVVRLTVTNDGKITNFEEIATQYNTVCRQCDDDVCESEKPCQKCEPGFKSPECRYDCEDGTYGVNCAEDCSKGCEDICNRVSGECSCQKWWTSSKCTTQIRKLGTSTEEPTVSSYDDSSAAIQWKKITNVPAGLSDHYQYVIEYKNETSSSWVEWPTGQSHDPSSDHYQEATLTNLTYNTVYDVRVKSFRVLGGDREEIGVTGENKFQTDCKAPSEPQDVLVKSLDKDNKSVLNVTWKHPKEIGCNRIVKYTIKYRLRSSPSENWKLQETLPAASTSHTFKLDKGIYAIRVEVTNDGNSSDSSNYAEMGPNPDRKQSTTDGGDTSLIAGLVVGVLILVILLGVLGFILYRRRQPGIFFGRRKGRPRDIVLAEHLDLPEKDPSDTDSYEGIKEETQPSTSNTKKIPLLPTSLNSLASRIGKLRPGSAKSGPSKPPIPKKPDIAPVDDAEEETAVQIGDSRIRLENLAAYIKNKENETDGFKNEYSVLKKDLQHPCVEGEKEEHRIEKNRYRNIIAYDHARVVLGLWEGDPNSSYVNASYISGYGNVQREYVAAQGPKPETKEDFWRMMWLLNSNCIVMVTMTVENGRDKCVQYWPGKSEGVCQYADIKVETRQEEPFADYVVRIFEVEKEGETRTIHQFHFTSWIDRSAPEHIFPLLHFRRKVMAFNDRRTGPLVVHCSAGVGRTGTFIAIDYLDKQAQAKHYVDVRSCVEEMRTQRPNMVQTLPQYVFVYKSILELFEIGNTAIPCDQLASKFEDLRSDGSAYANTTKLREQFELLNEQRIVPDDDDVAALSAENKTKNRCLNIVPSDRYRPYLSTWQSQSDYVNAVYIDSYRKRDMYIVTQTPMPETLTDFWRLVFEHNCNTIIMMENVDDSDQTVATYWPELVGTKQENGPLTIELLGEDTSGQPGLVSRDFIVAPTKRATRRPAKVKQFQLTAWDADDQLTTNLQKELLNLIEKVDAWQAQVPKGPILIHCVNGASRSGLFCAANYLIDMIRTEQEVDVFYVVRHIRAHRPQLVDGLEQYQFLHELALTYMTQYATYSNYTGGT